MRVHSEWDDAGQTVIRSVHERDWTWMELHEHNETTLANMVQSVSHPVNVIVDMLNSPYFPPQSFAEHVRRATETYNTLNIDLVVFIIREDDIGQLLLSAHRRFGTNRDYFTARDIEEARAIIKQAT